MASTGHSPKRLCVHLGAWSQSPASGPDLDLYLRGMSGEVPLQELGWGAGGVWISLHLGAVFCMPDVMFPVLAQEQPGPWPWGTVAFVMGSSPPGVSAASPAGHLGRAQKGHPLGTVFSSGISSASWVWLSARTQLCPSLSARTAMPSSTSATASSHLSCSESMFPRQAAGSLVQSRRPFPPLLGACRRPCEQGCMGTGQPGCLVRQTLMSTSALGVSGD